MAMLTMSSMIASVSVVCPLLYYIVLLCARVCVGASSSLDGDTVVSKCSMNVPLMLFDFWLFEVGKFNVLLYLFRFLNISLKLNEFNYVSRFDCNCISVFFDFDVFEIF